MRKSMCFLLFAMTIVIFFTACGGNNNQKIDVEKYREKVREQRGDNSVSPEKAQEARKSLFPKLKENND